MPWPIQTQVFPIIPKRKQAMAILVVPYSKANERPMASFLPGLLTSQNTFVQALPKYGQDALLAKSGA